jgi:DNA-directed RNA polymerase specialized sigma24 family protein
VLTSDEVIAAVRVHADRVHDAVRRLGCGPEAATQVVERSALALVDAVSRQPESVGDPVGWWFAKARALGRQVAGGDGDLPLGGGVLSTDANQVRLAEALEGRPERERAALLLRDSYDLPASAVGTALGLDAQGAMEVVGAARLALLPTLTGTTVRLPGDHAADIAALARLGEGGAQAVRDATTRRHVRSCERCAEVLSAQERARRVLTGLTVVALPDAERSALLARVESRARAQLPGSDVAPLLDEWEEDDEEHGRLVPLSLLALGVVIAVGLGIGIGLLTSRGTPISPTGDVNRIPLVTAAPVLSVLRSPTPTATPSATATPSLRVFIITPSPTPTPTATSPTTTATPSATREPLTLSLSPTSGPNDTDITVTGTGWIAGATVTVQYMNSVGGQPGATVNAIVDDEGRFSVVLPAHDDQGIPGQHQVNAQDGTNFQQASFTATG